MLQWMAATGRRERLLGPFITSTAEIGEGMKNGFYHFIVLILTTMAKKGALEGALDRSIGHWMKSTFFMGTFTRATLDSPSLTRPVKNFKNTNIDKCIKIAHNDKTQSFITLGTQWSVHTTPFSTIVWWRSQIHETLEKTPWNLNT